MVNTEAFMGNQWSQGAGMNQIGFAMAIAASMVVITMLQQFLFQHFAGYVERCIRKLVSSLDPYVQIKFHEDTFNGGPKKNTKPTPPSRPTSAPIAPPKPPASRPTSRRAKSRSDQPHNSLSSNAATPPTRKADASPHYWKATSCSEGKKMHFQASLHDSESNFGSIDGS